MLVSKSPILNTFTTRPEGKAAPNRAADGEESKAGESSKDSLFSSLEKSQKRVNDSSSKSDSKDSKFTPLQKSAAQKSTDRKASEPAREFGEFKQILESKNSSSDDQVNATQEGSEVQASGFSGGMMPNPGVNTTPPSDRGLVDTNQIALPMGKGKSKAVGGEVDPNIDSLTRRVVWNDFLRKMREEFGVSVEDVLGAFASLTAEDLAKPPHETVDKVVMALGLDEQQSQLAKQYFTALIDKTESKSMGEELAASKRQISLSLMSQRELQRKELQSSLERMNHNFFMQGQAPKAQTPVADPGSAQAPSGNMKSQMPVGMQAAGVAPAASPIGANPNLGSVNPMPSENGMVDSVATKSLNSGEKTQLSQNAYAQKGEAPAVDLDSLIQKFTVTNDVAPKELPIAPASESMESILGRSMSQSAKGASATASAAAPVAVAGASVAAGLGGLLTDSEDSEDMIDFDSEGMPVEANGFAGATKLNGDATIQSPQAPAQPNQVTVPEVIESAQVLVREGGGEMKVTLNPDGLGEVALKVNVENGKVSVQMITESDEAKRLIERELGGLKNSLMVHDLAVDTIKVDTATHLGKQLEQQYQEAQRQMAHQALEQFRQDQQGWRKSFFEVPSAKAYQSQADAPSDVQAPSGSRKKEARRLDLVA